MKTIVCASGKLGFENLKLCTTLFEVKCIACDSQSEEIINFAKENAILLFKGNPRNQKLSEFLALHQVNCDWLLSINYLFLLEQDVLSGVKKAINFHGSLLPKYRGRTPHVWAIINGETKTGVTAHFIESGCDTGDVLLQQEVAINSEETGADILLKFQKLYPILIRELFEKLKKNELVAVKQDEKAATYFGKRTPNDGSISWDWSGIQIKNWVRAQAFPYPGAFSFIDDQQIIIDKVQFYEDNTEIGKEAALGQVVSDYPKILVKISDGLLEIVTCRNNVELIKSGKKFNDAN